MTDGARQCLSVSLSPTLLAWLPVSGMHGGGS
jgi:hypothetical protein